MAQQQRRGNLLQFVLIFALVYLGSQFVLQRFFPEQFGGEVRPPVVTVRLQDATLTSGHHPVLLIENNRSASGAAVTLASRCPNPPVDVFFVEGESRTPLVVARGSGASITGCEASAHTIEPGNRATVSLAPWKNALFTRLGTYEVVLPAARGTQATGSGVTAPVDTLSARFTMDEPGPFTKLFRVFITAPFLNTLVFIASLLPDHNLGIAIIVLTFLVKLLLFIPTKHALEGQKKMQMLQPKMEAIKKQYSADPKKLQEETMKLWSENKINPFQSCLPTLIQLPILIGLFYVIRDSSSLDASRYLLYSFFEGVTWNFNTNFLGLDLLQPNYWLMPPLLVALQFLQMKLAFKIQNNKKAQSDVIDIAPKGEKAVADAMASAPQMQQKVMLYGLPLLIGVFAFQFPAAVSLYWGVSTVFGIGQQILVNREHLRVKK